MGLQHVVVMGVSGCGKSTVAEGLAEVLGWPFCEGDSLHPQTNIAKMAAGVALEDADRWPWLEALAASIARREQADESSVMTCSALKRAYRDVLRGGADRVRFVHLHGDQSVLATRLAARKGHFFPAALLASQYADLEPLGADEDGVVVDLAPAPEVQVAAALRGLGLG